MAGIRQGAGHRSGAIASDAALSFDRTKATYLEEDVGLSYRFHSNWSAGLEFRNHNEFANWSLAGSDQQHIAFFGPNIHGGQRWFATLAVLRQLGAHGYTEDQRSRFTSGACTATST